LKEASQAGLARTASEVPLPFQAGLGLQVNAVEGCFARLTRQRLKRGVFKHSRSPGSINRYLAETNQNPKPFIWTADPDVIIEKLRRAIQALESIH
jgi:hypothetical protein